MALYSIINLHGLKRTNLEKPTKIPVTKLCDLIGLISASVKEGKNQTVRCLNYISLLSYHLMLTMNTISSCNPFYSFPIPLQYP